MFYTETRSATSPQTELYYACQLPQLDSVDRLHELSLMVPSQDDIFIAYLPEDMSTIRQLDEAILAEGFKPGVGDPASLLGVRADGQIDQGILDCDAFLVFVGAHPTIPRDLEDELAQAIALNKLIILVASQPLAVEYLAVQGLNPVNWEPVSLDETVKVLKALARTVVHCLTYVRLQARALAWQQASGPDDKERFLLSAGDIEATNLKIRWIETYLGGEFTITPLQRELLAASRVAIEASGGKDYFYGSVPDIFISYSRQDQDFVRPLSQALKQNHYRVWVDWENIPIAADWTQEVDEGIVAAHTFIFVISPDSVLSEHCQWELERARACNRRIIPICCQPGYDKERLERLELTKLNYGLFTPVEPPETLDQAALKGLLERLCTDLEDVKEYNRLFTKAHEWDAKHRLDDLLMRPSECKAFGHWLQSRTVNPKHIELKALHPLQQAYITASQTAIARQTARRRSRLVVGTTLVLAALSIISGVAISARIGTVNALIESLTEQKELNGLITALKASQQLQQTPLASRQPDLRRRTITALHAETLNVREVNQFSSNQWGIFDVAFSPDGRQLISVGEDGAVRSWNSTWSTGNALDYRLSNGESKHRQQVVAVDYSSDGDFFASGGYDGNVNIWSCPSPGAGASRSVATTPVKTSQLPGLQGLLPTWSGADTAPVPTVDCRWVETLPKRHGLTPPGQTEEPDRRISRIGISPGSQYLASAGFDGQVFLWERSRGPGAVAFPDQPKKVLPHDNRVYGLDFSKRNQLLATADRGGVVKIWSLIDGEAQGQLSLGADQPVSDVAFSPDGQILAAATGDGTLILWDWQTNQRTALPAHDKAVVQVKFSPDGSTLASADGEGNIKLWRVDRLRPIPQSLTLDQINDGNAKNSPLLAVLKGHQDHITQIQFSPDGRMLASASLDNTVRLWVTADGALLDVIEGHQDQVLGLAFSPLRQGEQTLDGPAPPDTLKLASASRDGTIRLWRVNTAVRPLVHDNLVYDVAFRPDGQFLASAGKGSIRIWRVADQRLQGHIGYDRLSTEIYTLDYHPDPKADLIVAGDSRGQITLWKPDVSTRAARVFWEAHPEPLNVANKGVTVVRFSPSGKFIASGGADGHLKLWSLEQILKKNFQPLQDIDLGQVVTSLSFSADETRLVVSSTHAPPPPTDGIAELPPTANGDLKLFAVDPGHHLTELAFPIAAANRHEGDILTVSFHPQRNDQFVSGDADGTIKIWSTTPGQAPQTLTGHEDGITRVTYSPDCTLLASSSRDRTVKLWQVPNPDSCSGSSADYLRSSPPALANLWPLTATQPTLISTLSRHDTQVTKVAFNPVDSTVFASSGFDQRVFIWQLPPGLNQNALNTLVEDGCSAAQDYIAMALYHQRLAEPDPEATSEFSGLATINAFCDQKLKIRPNYP
ncbi:MAG: TIR domain-containing protein [Nodosilinea sp.]